MNTILVVDDEFDNAEVLALILEEEGFRSIVAVNGRQALDCVREYRPDVVVTDFVMPVMNGAEMALAMRADVRTRQTKIVMCSVLAESAVRERFTDYDGFLRKPYGIETLMQMLARLLPSP